MWNRAARSLFLFLSGLAAALPIAGPAAAQPVVLRMEGWWGGFKGADIQFIVDEGDRDWQGRFLVKSAGPIRRLTKLNADATGQGPLAPLAAEPHSYVQHVVSNKSERTVELGFSGTPPLGRRISDREVYADPDRQARDPENVPDLPEEQRRGAMDPIAALLTLGRRIVAGEKHFVLPVYDGRRRFDLAVDLAGPRTHGLLGTRRTTLDAVAVVHPIAGFKPFHLRWWNNARFDLYLDPVTGLPLQISSSSFLATVVLTVKSICPSQSACAPQ